MKKNIIIVSIIAIITVLIGTLLLTFNNNNKISDAKKFSQEYDMTEENVFVYRNIDQIIKILEHGTGVVYLGFPECPWCKAYVKILNEVAIENGIDKIYYFNILEDRKNNTDAYQKIISLLNENLLFDEEGNKRIYVPDVTVVQNGEIIYHNNETSKITDSSLTPENYWTNENKNNLKNSLGNAFKEIEKNVCNGVCDR